MNRLLALVAGVAALALAPAAAQAKGAADLSDLVGARGGQAEGTIQDRGFVHITTSKSGSESYAYYWNQATDDCVRVTTFDGRYSAIDDVGDTDCNKHEGKDVAVAAAAIGVAAILGAVLANGDGDEHKSHHHESGQHDDDVDSERQYELGYRAGLYNTSYHNSDRSTDYSNGYSAGVSDRNGRIGHTRQTSDHSGYQPAVYVDDLQNARASAIDQLANRGFRQVDNFTSGTTRYGIWWNADTRQCLQATIADGRILDLRDIGQNPHCR